MKPERVRYPRMALVLFALFGLFDSVYLSLTRLQSQGLVCPAGGGCDVVQESRWSTLPPGNGLPVAYIGVVGYLVLFILGMIALHTDTIGPFPAPLVLLSLSSVGVCFSIYLVSIQLFAVKAICFWCMLSALFEVSIWVAALVDWFAWRKTFRHMEDVVILS